MSDEATTRSPRRSTPASRRPRSRQRAGEHSPEDERTPAEKPEAPAAPGARRGRGRRCRRCARDARSSRSRPESEDGTAASQEAPPAKATAPSATGRQRLVRAVWPPRVTRAQLIVALLLFVLGLGLAIQVRSTSENSSLRGARQEDLVRILDELDDRTKRLEDEKQSLENQRTELENSSDQAEEARKQTRQKARQLGVLAGTVGAQGPGIELTVTDPGVRRGGHAARRRTGAPCGGCRGDRDQQRTGGGQHVLLGQLGRHPCRREQDQRRRTAFR